MQVMQRLITVIVAIKNDSIASFGIADLPSQLGSCRQKTTSYPASGFCITFQITVIKL